MAAGKTPVPDGGLGAWQKLLFMYYPILFRNNIDIIIEFNATKSHFLYIVQHFGEPKIFA